MSTDGDTAWQGDRWYGVGIGPAPLRHDPLTGRDGLPGIVVRECAVCGRGPMRVPELLVRPARTRTWEGVAARIVEPAEVVGWVTSCLPTHHVVWVGQWELVYPDQMRLPRWESRSVPFEERNRRRREAFAVGGDVWIGTRRPEWTRSLEERLEVPFEPVNTLTDPETAGGEVVDLETFSPWVTGSAFPWPGPQEAW